jgi:hypothetical protein
MTFTQAEMSRPMPTRGSGRPGQQPQPQQPQPQAQSPQQKQQQQQQQQQQSPQDTAVKASTSKMKWPSPPGKNKPAAAEQVWFILFSSSRE